MGKQISHQELEALLIEEERLVLLDVREEYEFERGAIPNAVNVPFDRLSQFISRYSPITPIAIICNTINRSKAAVRFLEKNGYTDVYYVYPGMCQWEGPVDIYQELKLPSWNRNRNNSIYLDHAATAPVDPAVKEAINCCLDIGFGNPSSEHKTGRMVREQVARSRNIVAKTINVPPEDLIFTSGGTEANNAAIWGILQALPPDKKGFITSAIEHPAIIAQIPRLKSAGITVKMLPVDCYGMVQAEELVKAIDDKTGLVSVMLVNNEVGTIQPIGELCNIAHSKGAYFHCDAVQAINTMDVDVNGLGCDALSISGHKIGGPKGIGALYLGSHVPYCPLICGGGQEKGHRGGTENVPGIIGLGVACYISRQKKRQRPHMKRIRDYLQEKLSSLPGVRIFGHPTHRVCSHLCFALDRHPGYELVLDLDMAGIACSSGSACSSRKHEGSPVLRAMGFPSVSAVRLSLGWDNTTEQMDYVYHVVKELAYE